MRKGDKHYSYSVDYPEDYFATPNPVFPVTVYVLRHNNDRERTLYVIRDRLIEIEQGRPRRCYKIAARHRLVARAKAAVAAGAEWPVPLEVNGLNLSA